MRINILLLSLMAVLVVVGCRDNTTGTTSNISGDMWSATVDGQQWSAAAFNAIHGIQEKVINITAYQGGIDNAIAFTLHESFGIGTYLLNVDNPYGAQVIVNGTMHVAPALVLGETFGTVTITRMGNGRIAGTFNFRAYENGDTNAAMKTVTNGTFDIPLLEH